MANRIPVMIHWVFSDSHTWAWLGHVYNEGCYILFRCPGGVILRCATQYKYVCVKIDI